MAKKKYTFSYFCDGIDAATDSFHACYEIMKQLLDEAKEYNTEVKEMLHDEIAIYLANFLYLYHRDAFPKEND